MSESSSSTENDDLHLLWCCHDETPTGKRTWAAGIMGKDGKEFFWPPVDSESVYTSAAAVIEAARAAYRLTEVE